MSRFDALHSPCCSYRQTFDTFSCSTFFFVRRLYDVFCNCVIGLENRTPLHSTPLHPFKKCLFLLSFTSPIVYGLMTESLQSSFTQRNKPENLPRKLCESPVNFEIWRKLVTRQKFCDFFWLESIGLFERFPIIFVCLETSRRLRW